MRDAVRSAFVPLTISFEGGYIDWPFPDVKKLISTGFGLLLDPMSLAIGLPWRRQDGSLASREEIAAEWSRLKNYVEANPGSEFRSYKTFASLTTIRLGKEGLYQAFQGKMNHNEGVLRAGFPEWDSWPADAQLGAMSMGWATGPGFYDPQAGPRYWPKLTAALRARDFQTAAVESFMNEEARNPGIIPRNRANRVLFGNAAIVQTGLDPEVLYFPRDLGATPLGPDDETAPELLPAIVYSGEEEPIVHKIPPLPPIWSDELDEPDDEPPAAA